MENDIILVDKMIPSVRWSKCEQNNILAMNELMLQDHPEFPGLIDLGSCTIHIIHNAFGKGIDQ